MPAYRGSKLKVWAFPSHSTPGKDYETIQWANGELTCNCRGWIYPKNGNPRTCTHIQRAELELRELNRSLKEVVQRRVQAQARRKEFESNERMYEPPFKPEPFKKYKRLIRVDTEAQ